MNDSGWHSSSYFPQLLWVGLSSKCQPSHSSRLNQTVWRQLFCRFRLVKQSPPKKKKEKWKVLLVFGTNGLIWCMYVSHSCDKTSVPTSRYRNFYSELQCIFLIQAWHIMCHILQKWLFVQAQAWEQSQCVLTIPLAQRRPIIVATCVITPGCRPLWCILIGCQ